MLMMFEVMFFFNYILIRTFVLAHSHARWRGRGMGCAAEEIICHRVEFSRKIDLSAF